MSIMLILWNAHSYTRPGAMDAKRMIKGVMTREEKKKGEPGGNEKRESTIVGCSDCVTTQNTSVW
jgi:hypothetical protein